MDAAQRQARQAARGKATAAPVPGEKKTLVSDPDDQRVQEDVRNPKNEIVKIAGKEVRLHVLAAKYAKKFAGLVIMVMQDTASPLIIKQAIENEKNVLPTLMRIASVLQMKYAEDFLPLLVHATMPAGTYSQPTAMALAQKMEDEIEFIETARAYMTMVEQNGILEMVGLGSGAGTSAARPTRRSPRR